MSSVMLHPQTNVAGLWYQSATAEDSKLVFTGKGVLHTLFINNGNAAARWVYVFDGTSSSGTPIAGPILVAATSTMPAPIVFQTGIPFSTGLFLSASSTQKTHTAAGGTDCLFTVGYAKRPSAV